MGCGIESTSFKNGMIQESVVSQEVLTVNNEGEVSVNVVTEQSDQERFQNMPWSYGTLGMLLSVTLRLTPTKPQIRMECLRVNSYQEMYSQIKTNVKHGLITMEGLMFANNYGVLMLGYFEDEKDTKQKELVLNKWNSPWF